MFLFYIFFNFCEWIIKKNKENSNVLSFNFFYLLITLVKSEWPWRRSLSAGRAVRIHEHVFEPAIHALHILQNHPMCQIEVLARPILPPPESYALHSHLYYFVWNCTSFRYNQSQDWICSAYAPWLWSSSSPHPLNQPRSRHLLHRPAPLNRTVNTPKLKPLQVIHFLHNYTPHSPVSLCCWEGELLMLCSAGWFLLRGNNSSC